ncbi:hypothetical protein CYJ41_06570 [Campylobacter ureolyticus]|uniref:Uncharacterized protein n=1 Tax=Campylobacter ureolyticus TaxID=827 RepID=A0A2I1N8R0_9BACT|nr:hypothetical protein [Campylobacter ureolyticus]PKZ28762.1 hypothetical protein CYJ41_06570 [Campylobacter ureolyticus]
MNANIIAITIREIDIRTKTTIILSIITTPLKYYITKRQNTAKATLTFGMDLSEFNTTFNKINQILSHYFSN